MKVFVMVFVVAVGAILLVAATIAAQWLAHEGPYFLSDAWMYGGKEGKEGINGFCFGLWLIVAMAIVVCCVLILESLL